ncbi:putative transposase [uncultured archaeon]|nr:putative transposase [uncultured archaeon]
MEFDVSNAVGIDMGLKEFAVLSDSVVIDNPRLLKKSQEKLSKAQHDSDRKKLGSKNRIKSKQQVARIYRKIRSKRKDFQHKKTCSITKAYDFVFTENLAVQNMMANHHVAKAIGDVSWSQFLLLLEYKLLQKGGQLLKIGRSDPSSQLCSSCGSRHPMPLSERTYTCPVCGLVMDRDLNVAINILQIGAKKYFGKDAVGTTESLNACGDTKVVSVKQEAAALKRW